MPSFLLSPGAARRSELAAALTPILGKITDDTKRQANKMVDLQIPEAAAFVQKAQIQSEMRVRQRADAKHMTIQIRQGQATALFAFDIGFEVSMDKLSGMLSSVPVPPLTQKKQTPSYLQYASPPRLVNLGSTDALLSSPGNIQATVFDFGAASIAYRWPLTKPICSRRAPPAQPRTVRPQPGATCTKASRTSD